VLKLISVETCAGEALKFPIQPLIYLSKQIAKESGESSYVTAR